MSLQKMWHIQHLDVSDELNASLRHGARIESTAQTA